MYYMYSMYDWKIVSTVHIRACRKWNTGKFANVQIIYPRLRRRSVERVALKLCKSSIILCSRACDPTVDHFVISSFAVSFPSRSYVRTSDYTIYTIGNINTRHRLIASKSNNHPPPPPRINDVALEMPNRTRINLQKITE